MEPDLGIIVACVPTLQPVASRFRESLQNLASYSRGSSHRSLRSSSFKISDQKPAEAGVAEDRMYSLSEYEGSLIGKEAGVRMEERDIGRAHV